MVLCRPPRRGDAPFCPAQTISLPLPPLSLRYPRALFYVSAISPSDANDRALPLFSRRAACRLVSGVRCCDVRGRGAGPCAPTFRSSFLTLSVVFLSVFISMVPPFASRLPQLVRASLLFTFSSCGLLMFLGAAQSALECRAFLLQEVNVGIKK